MWMICVVIGSLHVQRECWPVRNEAQCFQAMHEWVSRSYAWSDRSRLPPRFLSVCRPRDEDVLRERVQFQGTVQAHGLPPGGIPQTGTQSSRDTLVP